jgi:microcompartment protein CcmK/EutM
MVIAEVVGTVVASQKTPNMQGLSLRIVRRVSPALTPSEAYQVAVDVVGAREGDYVLLCAGSAARQTHLTDGAPVDAVLLAIIDTWQVDGQVCYARPDSP